MKSHITRVLVFVLLPLLLGVGGACSRKIVDNDQAVNAIIGDASFVKKYGWCPTAETDEDLRIVTHLAYVEDLLRKSDVSQLSPELRANRARLLNLLRDYHENGVFPRNYDYQDERKPCFIDKDGRICAVGYLIEQTVGREAAAEINRKYQYEKLMAMNDPIVDHWIAASGLTKAECAMIQPSYGGTTVVNAEKNYISRGYGISSAIFSGVNFSIGTVNAIQIGRSADDKVVPLIGLATGAAQATLGILEYPKDETGWNGEPYANIGQRNVSLLNIGLGTASVLLSSWNLIANRPGKERSLRWGIQQMPMPDNATGLGFHVAKRF